MGTAKHIGIVAVSAEGAALCYRTICAEGAALLGVLSEEVLDTSLRRVTPG